VPPLTFVTAHRDSADAGQQADAPHVVVQMLAAHAQVPEWSLTSPDAIGDAAYRRERGAEGEPADQRGLLPGV
jgi:hypothetical protein